MPATYRQAREDTRHLQLLHVPVDIIERRDEIAAYDGRPRRIVILDILMKATGLATSANSQ